MMKLIPLPMIVIVGESHIKIGNKSVEFHGV